MLPDAVQQHYRQQQASTAGVMLAAGRQWDLIGQEDFDTAWRRIGPRLLTLMLAAQGEASRAGAAYVGQTLTELNVQSDPEGLVRPAALVGVASDGRDLQDLLYEPVIAAKLAVGIGTSTKDSLAAGRTSLERIFQTQLADAARVAAGLAIFTRPKVGWVRMLQLPSCSRCVPLAGKWFRSNQGFLRHPRCDCRHIAAPENIAGDLTTDPRKAVESGQVKGLSQADTKAILDGADVSQVVNAHRGANGMSYAGRQLKVTTEGTTRRGYAYQFLSNRGTVTESAGTATRLTTRGPEARAITRTRARAPRLMPETIYDLAGDDRKEALRLLKANGYLL